MNKRIKELCDAIVEEAVEDGTVRFLVDDVRYSIIEGVLARSSSISKAGEILGLSRGGIQYLKKNGYIKDIKREKGRIVEDLL